MAGGTPPANPWGRQSTGRAWPVGVNFGALFVAFLDEPSQGMWTALAILVIQQVRPNLVTPSVMSKTAEVHPFVTLFSPALFAGMPGFPGVLLALPVVEA